MSDLTALRRFFAEEVQMTSNLKSTALVDALATVARERFLPAGPWVVAGEADFQAAPRRTADADPRHVYHNISIAIDPARMLFNGAPGLVSMAIDALAPKTGDRILHIGTGPGYYTAVMARCVGPTGRVVGIEVDAGLAASARENLADLPWVEMRHGNASEAIGESFDAILVNAGVTHPQRAWLDALAPGGRIVVPITASMPSMGTIGKGLLLLITRTADPAVFTARIVTFVAIYSGIGLRDPALEAEIGKALKLNPFPPIKTLRRDAHEPGSQCWLHGADWCLSM